VDTLKYKGYFRIRCYDKKKELKWVEEGYNTLTTEGAKSILDTFFKDDTSAPTEFYIRLCNDSLVISDTLATIQNEPTSTFGYAAQLVERSSTGWPTEVLTSGSWQLTTKEVSFTASGGDIGPINTVYIATTLDNTGILVAFRALSLTRTILDGDTALVDYPVKLI
jgi:hypothetical protein